MKSAFFLIFVVATAACATEPTASEQEVSSAQEDELAIGPLLPGAGHKLRAIEYEGDACPTGVDFKRTPWYMCIAKHPMAYLRARTLFRDSAANSVLPAADGALEKCQGAVVSMGGWDPDQCVVTSCEACEND